MARLRFNALIEEAGFDPAEVRLLRHETQRPGRTPDVPWRDDPARFDDYRRVQNCARRAWFEAPRSGIVRRGAGRRYAGSATGADGFPGRWLAHAGDGHGGNVEPKLREAAAYRVSVLPVAGSADDREAVVAMANLWKAKLQSREMGLNRN